MVQENSVCHQHDAGKIKEWLAKQPHLPQNMNGILLNRFLHASSYSLEQTKYLIDLFYTIRSQAPEIFANRDPTHVNTVKAFEIIDLAPLPKLTENKCKLFIFRLANTDPEKYSFLETIRSFFMLADTRLIEESELPEGEIPIFDMQGYSLRHLTKVALPILKKYMTYAQEAHPIKLRQIHLINTPPFLDRCLALLKPFMNNKVGSMVHFHSPNSETLFEFVPKELLPAEYGGNVGKISEIKKMWLEKVVNNRDYFMDESRWRVDESKRPKDNPNGKQLFGLQGSFRSLSID